MITLLNRKANQTTHKEEIKERFQLMCEHYRIIQKQITMCSSDEELEILHQQEQFYKTELDELIKSAKQLGIKGNMTIGVNIDV